MVKEDVITKQSDCYALICNIEYSHTCNAMIPTGGNTVCITYQCTIRISEPATYVLLSQLRVLNMQLYCGSFTVKRCIIYKQDEYFKLFLELNAHILVSPQHF